MDSRRRTEDSYSELFPKDYPERLERLVEVAGLTWEEFAERLGVENDRVTAWRNGTIPTGGEVWHISAPLTKVSENPFLASLSNARTDSDHPAFDILRTDGPGV